MKLLTITIVILSFATSLFAQEIILAENFDDGIPSSWTVYDEDGLIPAEAVSEFTEAWIPFTDDTDTCIASTSYYTPSGKASDFLVSPKVSIGNYSKLVWNAKSVDASFPDGYKVLISTTDSLATSFTDTVYTTGAEEPLWSKRSIDLTLAGYENEDIYFAFVNDTEDGFILLLDSIKVLNAEFASQQELTPISFTTYPNPANGYVAVSTKDIIQSVVIYSMNGTLLKSGKTNTLSIFDLATGVYIIEVTTANGIARQEFIKQ
jgi:hypothetical protein